MTCNEDDEPDCNSSPVMLALCLTLSDIYFAKNQYAGITGLGLPNFPDLVKIANLNIENIKL